MKKILLVVIILIVAGAVYMANDTYKGRFVSTPKVTIGEMDVDAGGVTVATLAQHNSKDDCWIVYSGRVYDVTRFLPIHPGGVKKIAQFCGKAVGFEDAFHGQHGTSKVEKLKTQVGKFQGELQ